MTIAEIKEKLPDVKVLYKNKVYIGRVYGRTNKFPTTVITVDGHDIHFEVAWATVQQCLCKNVPIIY